MARAGKSRFLLACCRSLNRSAKALRHPKAASLCKGFDSQKQISTQAKKQVPHRACGAIRNDIGLRQFGLRQFGFVLGFVLVAGRERGADG
jgi:hypothetical protein